MAFDLLKLVKGPNRIIEHMHSICIDLLFVVCPIGLEKNEK